jgi:hypothetical protein
MSSRAREACHIQSCRREHLQSLGRSPIRGRYPAFGGSFSLKRIAAAILSDMSYEGLGVADGNQAGIVWARFVNPATYPEEKTLLKRALLQYCGQDTLALARILEVLLKQTRTSAG